MLDIKKIKENPEAVKVGLRAKEVDCDATVDRILELDEQRRQLIASTEQRKAMQNKVSKEIPLMKKQGKDVAPLFAEMAELKAELAEDAAKLDAVSGKMQSLERNILQYAEKLGLTPSGRVRLAQKRAQAAAEARADPDGDLFGD